MPGVSTTMIKFVPSGVIQGAQRWSTGLWCQVNTTGTPLPADMVAALNAVVGLFDTWAGALKQFWMPVTTYDRVSAYFYAAGATKSSLSAISTRTPVVGIATIPLPPRNCVVTSLQTGFPGKSFNGRSYFPCTGSPLSALSQLGNTQVDLFPAAYKVLTNGLNAATLGGPWTNAVLNVRSNATGVAHPVTQFRTDSLLDTQRRHEDKIAATYQKVLPI